MLFRWCWGPKEKCITLPSAFSVQTFTDVSSALTVLSALVYLSFWNVKLITCFQSYGQYWKTERCLGSKLWKCFVINSPHMWDISHGDAICVNEVWVFFCLESHFQIWSAEYPTCILHILNIEYAFCDFRPFFFFFKIVYKSTTGESLFVLDGLNKTALFLASDLIKTIWNSVPGLCL